MWYDADENNGPTIYETFKKALLKALSDDDEVVTKFDAIWEQ